MGGTNRGQSLCRLRLSVSAGRKNVTYSTNIEGGFMHMTCAIGDDVVEKGEIIFTFDSVIQVWFT